MHGVVSVKMGDAHHLHDASNTRVATDGAGERAITKCVDALTTTPV
jgi:hypothetical protein